ncbi:hypothetical protein ACJMK2_030982 [Sinanodonta woodiana]|uniref:EF-hand domain-containing protein n=1 Tax=Sinanodonta woodiana TaxID=1069815 RepID=A0ABD3WZ55_SINWO
MEITVPILSALGPEKDYYELSKLRQREIEIWLQRVDEQTRLMKTQGRHEAFGVSEKQDITQCAVFADHFKRKEQDAFESLPQVKIYRKSCKKMHILPMRIIIQQFGKDRTILRNLSLSYADIRATCKALAMEDTSTFLDISGNDMGQKEIVLVTTLLTTNPRFSELHLAESNLKGVPIQLLTKYLCVDQVIKVLDLSGNKFTDSDGLVLTEIITKNTTLKCLYLNHNQFQEAAGKSIGRAIGENDTLEELELSWNHLRQQGAVGLARGIEKNRSLKRIDLSWNGFAFEGCVAIADALVRNIVLEDLDLSSNRIHPPAVLELMRGLTHNKTLKILHLSRNPMTPPFVTILLEGIKKSPTMALEQLIMEGIVVDRDFDGILKSIQSERHFIVTYEMSLPVSGKKRNDLLKDVTTRNAYNIEPLRLLYLLKEKNRAQDFFHKINKDNNDCLTRDELYLLFKEAGIPVTQMVIDRIMKFMDKDKDGTIDLGEFLQGDKRIKKISRDQARNSLRIGEEAHYTRYSRTFRNAHIEPVTSRLKVDEGPKYLSPIVSRNSSPNSSRRSSIGFDLQ